MPKNKDLKRRVRARMQKTGESYTTARAQLLQKKTRSRCTPAKKLDFAGLAGISDEAVQAKTGCNWQRWVGYLDDHGADSMSHREIARHIAAQFDVSPWWAQTVTVGYERIKGLRDIGQRRGGTYDANKSKTLAVPVAQLYRAFRLARTRDRWLPDTQLTIRKATPDKSLRITWHDGTSVEAYFTSKGDKKSQVAVQHRMLASKAEAEQVKKFWGERLEALAEMLVPAKRTGRR